MTPYAPQLVRASTTFKMLADEGRLRLLLLLVERGPLCVSSLCEALGQPHSGLSRHLSLLRLLPDQITQVFGFRITKRLRGKLQSVLEKIDHGPHVFRACGRNAVLRMYEKFWTRKLRGLGQYLDTHED